MPEDSKVPFSPFPWIKEPHSWWRIGWCQDLDGYMAYRVGGGIALGPAPTEDDAVDAIDRWEAEVKNG